MPAGTDSTVVEQRILEVAVRLPINAAVTAWASLRWRGGTFFDGTADGGRAVLPVPVDLGCHDIGRDSGIAVSRAQFAPHEVELVDGVPCAEVLRAVFDEMRRTGRLRPAVIAVEMAVAADLLTLDAIRAYVGATSGWTGIPLVRRALALADANLRSPQESAMRLVWMLDAGLPTPVCNQPVFDLNGRLLGLPDLLDVAAGVVGEYDGAHHREDDRRQHDLVREQLFRDHGLEVFTVVRGDLADLGRVVGRMHAARSRARFLPPDRRLWTLDQPDWWRNRATPAA